MTEKISMTGTISCREGKGDEMEAVLVRMTEAAKSDPGIEIYAYFRGENDAFSFFALMKNEACMQSHGQSPEMQAVMADFGPLMDAPPQMAPSKPIAAIGFDL